MTAMKNVQLANPQTSHTGQAKNSGSRISPNALEALLAGVASADPAAALPASMSQDLSALAGRGISSDTGDRAANPLNIVRVASAAEIKVPESFARARVKLELAGYSNADLSKASGYNYPDAARALMEEGGGRLGVVVSPTADAGSIDAAMTGAALAAHAPLLSVTAEEYVKYIDIKKLAQGISKELYLAQPKQVLPTAEAYVEANAQLTNSWMAMGGGDVAAKAFREHVEYGHPIVLVDDGRGPLLSADSLRSNNASSWLADKLRRLKAGDNIHSVTVKEGTEYPYDPARLTAAAKSAQAVVKAAQGTTHPTSLAAELAKANPGVPLEAFADAMMFEKSGLSQPWLEQNIRPRDPEILVLRLGSTSRVDGSVMDPAKASKQALEFIETALRRSEGGL